MSGKSSVPSAGLWRETLSGAAQLGSTLARLGSPTIRLGVTGLSRSGKTVFITAMVHGLLAGARLPAFRVMGEGRLAGARLTEHPDGSLPRFAYEDHLATLTGPDRAWPNSTRRISALNLDLTYRSKARYLGGLIGPNGLVGTGDSTLALEVVDYPGEWLLDLPLLAKSYAEFSVVTLKRAEEGARRAPFQAFNAALGALDAALPAEEPVAQHLARLFTEALRLCREEGRELSALAPGRFLMPGDLEGAPALTFIPLPPGEAPPGSLRALMARRYEAYKKKVVRPFFADHFSRIDRQIVLVDVLGAINGGPEALADLEDALVDVLAAFSLGANSLFSSLFAPRVSKLLFAATKADHLHHTNHEKLEAILSVLVRRAQLRAQGAGVPTDTLAIAAIRATREVVARQGGEELACIAGVPLKGETLDGEVFDGTGEAAFFPGDLPADVESLFLGAPPPLKFLRFRPPNEEARKAASGLPQIRLDRALEFLLGDALQ